LTVFKDYFFPAEEIEIDEITSIEISEVIAKEA
jgi:hypothetical protein